MFVRSELLKTLLIKETFGQTLYPDLLCLEARVDVEVSDDDPGVIPGQDLADSSANTTAAPRDEGQSPGQHHDESLLSPVYFVLYTES